MNKYVHHPPPSSPGLQTFTLQLRGRLAGEVRACFRELQESVPREAAKGVPADGTVHPLCASTLSLLRRTLGYQSALRVLFGGDAPSPAVRPAGGGSLAEEARLQEQMGAAVGRILETLLAALDGKARAAYKSRALAALHQMNNWHYIHHAMGASRELKAVCDSWAERSKPEARSEEFQQAYIEAAWGSVLLLLRQDARQAVPANLAGDKAGRAAIKEKWTAVNRALAEATAEQAWAVPDAALRYAVRDAVSDQLVPLYTAFHAKYKTANYTDHHAKHEKYSPSDVTAMLGELFERAESAGSGAAGMVGRSPSRSPGSTTSMLGRHVSGSMRRLTSSSGQGTP